MSFQRTCGSWRGPATGPVPQEPSPASASPSTLGAGRLRARLRPAAAAGSRRRLGLREAGQLGPRPSSARSPCSSPAGAPPPFRGRGRGRGRGLPHSAAVRSSPVHGTDPGERPPGPARCSARHTRPVRRGWRELRFADEDAEAQRRKAHPAPGLGGGSPGRRAEVGGGPVLLTFSGRLKTTHDRCHEPSCGHTDTHHTCTERRPQTQSRLGRLRKELGGIEAQTASRQVQGGPQWTPTGGVTRATVPWGDQSYESSAQNVKDAKAAAGPAALGGEEQTQLSRRRGGSRLAFQACQHLYKPACSSPQGRGKGARAGGASPPAPHAAATPPGAAPPHPGLAPAGSRWDRRHLLARTGRRPGPPGATRGGRPETLASLGAWSQAPRLSGPQSSPLQNGESRGVYPGPPRC